MAPRTLSLGPLALVGALCALGAMTIPRDARADDTVKHPGDHPLYSVEIEPHTPLGWGGFAGVYGGEAGFGLGARFSIPILHNGFIPQINNGVAVTFGIDWVHF